MARLLNIEVPAERLEEMRQNRADFLFNENLIMNKQLNDKLSKKDINKIIDERNDLKKIDWIYKNKIK